VARPAPLHGGLLGAWLLLFLLGHALLLLPLTGDGPIAPSVTLALSCYPRPRLSPTC
jgi:hypothetical protein